MTLLFPDRSGTGRSDHDGYGINLDGDRIRKNAPEAAKAYVVFEAHLLDKYPG